MSENKGERTRVRLFPFAAVLALSVAAWWGWHFLFGADVKPAASSKDGVRLLSLADVPRNEADLSAFSRVEVQMPAGDIVEAGVRLDARGRETLTRRLGEEMDAVVRQIAEERGRVPRNERNILCLTRTSMVLGEELRLVQEGKYLGVRGAGAERLAEALWDDPSMTRAFLMAPVATGEGPVTIIFLVDWSSHGIAEVTAQIEAIDRGLR